MAHSIAPATAAQPDGTFTHAVSGTTFSSRAETGAVLQSFTRAGRTSSLKVEYAIGSGTHAVGYLAQIGNHLFQSPISYYTARRIWDMAPGYEQARDPGFTRPVTLECLTCHVDQPRPIPDTINSYTTPPFAGLSIQCDRCHGPAANHLKKPLPGSIVNPAKLPIAQRDSICEQCHLAGEIRIPNPGKIPADFIPGQRTEDVFTVYIESRDRPTGLRVISHSEQLALSRCARESSGKLWCGTCHNPHSKPVEAAAYYRERCLTCHAATLPRDHAAPGRDCIGCHMPRLPAKDGGHTAFTDHRIARRPDSPSNLPETAMATLKAWREPGPALRDRNLALALATHGIESSNSAEAIRGYRLLNRLEPTLANDADALTVLGSVLLTAKQPHEAEIRFEKALALRPRYAPYEVNLASAFLADGDLARAIPHLEHALTLDPLLTQAVQLLSAAYRQQGHPAQAEQLTARYQHDMGVTAQ